VGAHVLVRQSIGGPHLVVTPRSGLPKLQPPIQVEAIIDSAAARLFNAWTIPEYVEAWYANASAASVRADIDLRSGGHYHFEVVTEHESELIWGVYRRVQFPCKLTYSFRSNRLAGSTLVVVSLFETSGTTRLSLRQDGFSSAQESLHFASEWTSRIERLSRLVA
jgi:uncharacterized protein YndB with AHSA1/START domain